MEEMSRTSWLVWNPCHCNRLVKKISLTQLVILVCYRFNNNYDDDDDDDDDNKLNHTQKLY